MLVVFLLCQAILSFGQSIEERKVSAFDKINVDGNIKVFMKKGAEEKVKLVVSGIDLKNVITNVNGKTLEVVYNNGLYMDASTELYITYKEIREITVGASGKVSLQDTLTGDKVVFTAGSKGEITASLNLRTADVKVGQGASVRLKGKIGSIEVKANTKGIFAANDLQSDSTYVDAGSAGIVKVKAIFLLDANLSTGATLTYSGNPKNKSIKTGLGVTVNEIK